MPFIRAAEEDLVREVIVRDGARSADRSCALTPRGRTREVRKDGVRRALERARVRPVVPILREQSGRPIDRDAARPFAAQIGGDAFKSCRAGLAGAVGEVCRHILVVRADHQVRAPHTRSGADSDHPRRRMACDAQRAADGNGRRLRPRHLDEAFELICHLRAEIRHRSRIVVNILDFARDALQGVDDVLRVDADVRLAVHHHVRLLRPRVDLHRVVDRCDRRVIADTDVRRLREEVDVRRAGEAERAAVARSRIRRRCRPKIGIVLGRQELHRLRGEGGQRHVQLMLEALRLAGDDLLHARPQGQRVRDHIRNAPGSLRRVSNVVVDIETRALFCTGLRIVRHSAELRRIVSELRLLSCRERLKLRAVFDEIHSAAVYLIDIVSEPAQAVVVLMAVRADVHSACRDIRVLLHGLPVLVLRVRSAVRHIDLCLVVKHADENGCVREDFRRTFIFRIDHAALRRHVQIRHIVFRREIDIPARGNLVRDADIRRPADVERRRIRLDAHSDARAEREHLREAVQHAALFLRLAGIERGS